MTETEAIETLDRLIVTIRSIWAQRWLREWPQGNSERPKPPPHVVEYLKQQDTYALRSRDSV